MKDPKADINETNNINDRSSSKKIEMVELEDIEDVQADPGGSAENADTAPVVNDGSVSDTSDADLQEPDGDVDAPDSEEPADSFREDDADSVLNEVINAGNGTDDMYGEPLAPAFIQINDQEMSKTKKDPKKIKWAFLIPAIVVILGISLFAVASQAGWIQTFMTPQAVTTIETTEPVTTEKETPTKERPTPRTTTAPETTTAYTPSYYVIDVNLAYNVVTVYARGEKLNDGADKKDPKDDVYDLIPMIAFTCSPGVEGSTPTGTFYLQDRADWCFMVGDVYTQYATRIVDDVMFHSVPYFTKDPGDLETNEYNILGYEASSACIRLNVRDAAWIFNHCAMDTEVNIFYDWGYYGPLDPEPIYKIPTNIPELAGWDPTDVYSYGNPWLTYQAVLSYDTVSLPSYSNVDDLLAVIGPTDAYGNNLAEYFYTDGGYDLDTPGTYYTTGYIDVGNLSFSYPITIIVTEEISDRFYEQYAGGYYDEYGNYIEYGSEDTYTEDGGDAGGYYDEYGNYIEYGYDGTYSEDAYYDAAVEEEYGGEEDYSGGEDYVGEGDYSEDYGE